MRKMDTDLKTLVALCRLRDATRAAEKALDEQTGLIFELFIGKTEWANLTPDLRHELLHDKELANGMSRILRGLRADIRKEMQEIEQRIGGSE